MRTLFKHNGQVIYSIDFDVYINELQLLVNEVARSVEADPFEIELSYEEIPVNVDIDKSNICVTDEGKLIFDMSFGNEFGVNFMENKPINGIRLSCDLKIDGVLERFLDKIVDNKADENLEFII